jgi:hypothetical protein
MAQTLEIVVGIGAAEILWDDVVSVLAPSNAVVFGMGAAWAALAHADGVAAQDSGPRDFVPMTVVAAFRRREPGAVILLAT